MNDLSTSYSSQNLQTEDVYYRSHDDLVLHAKIYGAEDLPGRPVICLPGLTRNGRDFHDLAVFLATHPLNARQVYCLDYRGRGLSQWDKDWENYAVDIELRDVLDFMTARSLVDVGIVGTSRGGIIAMMMAVVRPTAMHCLVLNDIGPVIETAGLARIMGYAGKIPVPRDWDEAHRLVRDMNKRHFTAVEDRTWDRIAHQLFNEIDGKPAAAYDPNIGKAISRIDITKPVPDMWSYFDALADMPVLILRGEHSDILSPATVDEMYQRHSLLKAITIQNEGHAPLLSDRYSQNNIADFFKGRDRLFKPLPVRPRRNHREIFKV